MWSYRNPVDVRFGRGGFARLAEAIGGRSYALVTYPDAYFLSLSAALESEAGKPVLTIDDIAPNPDIALLEAQTARFVGLPVEVLEVLGVAAPVRDDLVAAAPDRLEDVGRVVV